MVVLEAAAIGAASYGLYKGGEAGVEKGKQCRKEFQREKRRSTQRSALSQKTKTRSERIAEIMNMKKNVGTDIGTSLIGSSSFASRRMATNEASSDINNRHRAVMEKLASGRKEEEKKQNASKFRSMNPFKKK